MLYHLLYPLSRDFFVFNVIKYISFRTFAAIFTALIFYFVFGRRWIAFLKSKQFGQIIREDGPQTHLAKKSTPTMGGVLILVSVLFSSLLWNDLSQPLVWICHFVMLGFAAIGFVDDYTKVIRKDSKGFRGQYKIILEVAICLAAALFLYGQNILSTDFHFPFFKHATSDIGILYLYLSILVITGTANAVNLTDGLDGLVTVPAVSCFFSFALLAYAAGHAGMATYLQLPLVPGAGEITILCGAMIGALLAFLWYNTHPAEIFMGDVGALGIGGLLGIIALMTKNEILLVVIGGIFVLETVSVIVQVVSFKLTGKRIFRMAPLHHHFELKGWKESKVIVRFWIISFLLGLIALSTLKLR